MKYFESLVSLFWLFLSIIFFYLASSFPVAKSYAGVGSGVFPQIVSTFIFVLCVIHITQSFRRKDDLRLDIPNFRGIVINLGVLVAYLTCLSYLGYFLIFTPLFLIILLRRLNVLDWRKVVCIALGFDLFAYIVFFRLLGVELI